MTVHALAIALSMALAACASTGQPTDQVVVIEIDAPGATPAQIERAVTIPLENRLDGTAGVARIRSNTYEGHCHFEVEFEAMPAAEMLVRARAALTSAKLRFELPVESESLSVRTRAGGSRELTQRRSKKAAQ